MLALEPRLMFDAAALVTAVDGTQDAADSSQTTDPQADTQQDDQSEILDLFESYVPPAERSGNTLVFIDASVPDQDVLVEGLAEDTEVIVLEAGRDGVEQISEALDGREGLTSIHIVSHGDDGVLRLGNSLLSSENLDQYTTQLSAWGDALTEQADILLYGCDVAQGETGQDFIEQLAELTGADIAASTDDTGSAELGGDWELEASTGAIESDSVISAEAVSEYDHLLNEVPIEDFDGISQYNTGWDGLGNYTAPAPDPTDPGNDVLLLTTENPVNTVAQLETDLGLNTESGNLDSKLRNAGDFVTTGSLAHTTVDLFDPQYKYITFDYNFLSGESLAYNDTAFVSIQYYDSSGGLIGSPELLFLADVYQVPGSDSSNRKNNVKTIDDLDPDDQTGWQTYSLNIQDGIAAGAESFRISFIVTDVNDKVVNSFLLVDDLRLTLNAAPVIFNNSVTIDENAPLGTFVYNINDAITGNDNDQDGDALTYSFSSGNEAGDFAINSSTGVITVAGVIDYETLSQYTLEVTADDSNGGTDTAFITVDVNDLANEAPVATDNTVSTSEDTAYTFSVADFTYNDVEGDALVSATLTNLNLQGGTLEHSGGTSVNNGDTLTAVQLATLTYTPSPDFNGNITLFTFTVNDANNGTVSATISITVNAVTDIVADTATTDEDTPVTIDVLGNDAFSDPAPTRHPR
jgi:hypothetical protein